MTALLAVLVGVLVGAATPASAAGYVQTAYVRYDSTLLRSGPSTSSAKLDVSWKWRPMDVYCWHDYTDGTHYVWVYGRPYGSRYTGYTRADMVWLPQGFHNMPRC